ncbi:glycosyltransferase family 4 protein [Neobacillus sp. YX16]|uniref:glycosyltransferase family 4 protein n=1 Tax=Neobacillus sp. YX16 TaxID=3047874 RepID=UPI0024C2FF06|nr:glycosyltransferase family 4 protein [Neobacillus sp. YX16]WHZ05279.1 glycosyltransferase family 4 protein [Neobacillus sp. YX16]
MKVAMISWEYPPQFSGGLGIHCQAIVRELTSIGVSVDFYLPAFKKLEFETPDGMTIQHVQMSKPFSNYSYLGSVIWDSVMDFRNRLDEVFNPEGIDLIHAHDWMGVYAATGIAQKYKIPLIWTVHSTEFDRAAGKSYNPMIFTIEQEALGTVNHTISVSQRTKQILIDRYSADPEKITAIYNGIDVSSFDQLATRDYQKTDGHILFLGRLTGQKAPDDFLQAAQLVLTERNDVRFLLAGEGDLLHKLRLKARRLKIDDRVEFAGRVLGEKLQECYKNAIMFVLPARSEPFGITVLEAMAAGIPVIISTTTGVGEIIKNVQVIEPNQPKELAKAIIHLLDTPELRQALGQKGAVEARSFSWSHAAENTRQLYLKLLNTT